VSISGGKLSSPHAIKVKFTPQIKVTSTANAVYIGVM